MDVVAGVILVDVVVVDVGAVFAVFCGRGGGARCARVVVVTSPCMLRWPFCSTTRR